jgi:hypothetical protein
MIRTVLFVTAFALLPALADAQVYKCTNPATGKTFYTDHDCKDGELVVPARTEEDIRRDAEAAAQARQDALQREQIALERERMHLQAEQAARTAEALKPPSQSDACRKAMDEASFRASTAADVEQIRTARYNAALACGQPPPDDIVVAPQPYLPAVRGRGVYDGGGDGYGYGGQAATGRVRIGGYPNQPLTTQQQPALPSVPVVVRNPAAKSATQAAPAAPRSVRGGTDDSLPTGPASGPPSVGLSR